MYSASLNSNIRFNSHVSSIHNTASADDIQPDRLIFPTTIIIEIIHTDNDYIIGEISLELNFNYVGN